MVESVVQSHTEIVVGSNEKKLIRVLHVDDEVGLLIYKPFEVEKIVKLLERILAGKTKAEIRKMEDEYDRKS